MPIDIITMDMTQQLPHSLRRQQIGQVISVTTAITCYHVMLTGH